MPTPLNEKTLEKLLAVLEEFRRLDPEMPTQTASSLLFIALQDGIPVTDLGPKLGLSSATASRNVANLTKVNVKREKGPDLVFTEEDDSDRRIRRCHLSPRGLVFLEKLSKIIGA